MVGNAVDWPVVGSAVGWQVWLCHGSGWVPCLGWFVVRQNKLQVQVADIK